MEIYSFGETVRWEAGVEHPYLAELPHWRDVPKDRRKNLEFRRKLSRLCGESRTWRERVAEMCAADLLFWINSFCWACEPRVDESVVGNFPFISWRHQDPVIAAMQKFFGRRHKVGKKSRGQGASWLVAFKDVHAFLFRRGSILGLGSKNMFYADDQNNPGSLGWKVDFVLANLPLWMVPDDLDRSLSSHSWSSKKLGNVIVAESSTEGIGRAGRYTEFDLDESAFYINGGGRKAVQNLVNVTNAINMPSTPNGQAGDGEEYYKRATTPSPWLWYVLAWQDNPDHSRGLYQYRDGRVEFLDRSYQYPADYEFVMDGRLRSAWYDRKWHDMLGNVIDVSRELDMDFGGSKARPFSEEILAIGRAGVKLEQRRGLLTYEPSDLSDADYTTWIDEAKGEFRLWMNLNDDGTPPAGQYVIGCDVAGGTAGELSSNSVMQIFNGTGEQVGEFASNRVEPVFFAQLVVATSYWLGRGRATPYVIWERNGPTGMAFTKEMSRLKYPNIYYMRVGESGFGKVTDKPGYHTSKTNIPLNILLSSLANREILLRSDALLKECGQYEYDGNDYVHPVAKNSEDASAKGASHGDRAMAAAMAVIGMHDRNMLQSRDAVAQRRKPELWEAPANSMGGRMWREQKNSRFAKLANCQW